MRALCQLLRGQCCSAWGSCELHCGGSAVGMGHAAVLEILGEQPYHATLPAPAKPWVGLAWDMELSLVVLGLCTQREQLGKLLLEGNPFCSVKYCSRFLLGH